MAPFKSCLSCQRRSCSFRPLPSGRLDFHSFIRLLVGQVEFGRCVQGTLFIGFGPAIAAAECQIVPVRSEQAKIHQFDIGNSLTNVAC